jgi:membrane dipeptidase
VIYSHSNPAALYEHPRNIPDEALVACAATGGVVGINGGGILLGRNDNSTDTFVRHLDYAVQLIGIDHVGIGLDYVFDESEFEDYLVEMGRAHPGLGYDKGVRMVAPEQIAPAAEHLGRLGYSEGDLAAVLGGNWLRVAHAVWKPPSSLSA